MTALLSADYVKKRGLIQRLKLRFRKIETRTITDEHGFSAVYSQLTLPRSPRKEDFDKLAAKIIKDERFSLCGFYITGGKFARELSAALCEKNLIRPPDVFLRTILFAKYLGMAKQRCLEQSDTAALIDHEGDPRSREMLFSMAKVFKNIAVVTANGDYFSKLADELMEQTGTAIMIFNDLEGISGCNVAVVATGGERLIYLAAKKRSRIVINMTEESSAYEFGLRNIISRAHVTLPQERRALFPLQFSDYDLCCAMCAEGAMPPCGVTVLNA